MKSSSALEVSVAKLYLFLLPFRMIAPFEFIKDVIGPLANYVDTLLLIWGLLLWMSHEGSLLIPSSDRPLYRTIKYSIFYLNISSLFMAVVMFLLYGDYNGKSPFVAILPMELFYFQYLFMFLYNIRVFMLLSYTTIVRIISRVCTVLLVIGYIQVLVKLDIGVAIYDFFAGLIGGFLESSSMTKLSLTCSEGAGAGVLLGIFVFPFLFASYLHGNNKSLYQLFLWLIPLYFISSTSAFILFTVDLLVFLSLFIRRYSINKLFVRGLTLISILCAAWGVLSYCGVLNTQVYDEISYLLFEKATSDTDGSTATRTVPFIINWGCFTEMPFFGVGNGLQGYFYLKYFPLYLLDVPGTDLGAFYQRILEPGGIANGSTFLPGYFSGYGIAGIIVMINFIIKLRRTRKQRARRLGLFNEMFIMGSVAFLIAALSSEMYCLYYAWFVLSIPFMNYHLSKNGNQTTDILHQRGA